MQTYNITVQLTCSVTGAVVGMIILFCASPMRTILGALVASGVAVNLYPHN